MTSYHNQFWRQGALTIDDGFSQFRAARNQIVLMHSLQTVCQTFFLTRLLSNKWFPLLIAECVSCTYTNCHSFEATVGPSAEFVLLDCYHSKFHLHLPFTVVHPLAGNMAGECSWSLFSNPTFVVVKSILYGGWWVCHSTYQKILPFFPPALIREDVQYV